MLFLRRSVSHEVDDITFLRWVIAAVSMLLFLTRWYSTGSKAWEQNAPEALTSDACGFESQSRVAVMATMAVSPTTINLA